jgi:hypothetical protein
MCVAVGDKAADPTDPIEPALFETWNGSAWLVSGSPHPSPYGNELLSVSCLSATNCTAAGDDQNSANSSETSTQTLIEHWNGSHWRLQVSADVADAANNFTSLSCLKSGVCVAAGSFDQLTLNVPLIEIRTHGVWAISPTPSPGGAEGIAYLTGISCSDSTNCVAVGYNVGNGGEQFTFVEQWNGTQWSIVSSPSVSDDSSLHAVKCTSSADCFAVGSAISGSTLTGLIEQGT